MLDPVNGWHQEHMYFRRLLALLQQEMDCFASGEQPHLQLMLDILAYLREWGDRSHHPREDEAFRRIVAKRPERQLPIARLMQEHRVIAHAGEQLENLLNEVQAGAILERAQVEMAAATYLVYYGNHIGREEADILPLAATLLTDADWQAVKNAAATDGIAPAVAAPDRLLELRHRIETAAA